MSIVRSGDFSMLALCLAVTHWKKLAVVAVAGMLGTGYCVGRAVSSHTPPPAAVTTGVQKFYNMRAREAFAGLGLKPAQEAYIFKKTANCEMGADFTATTAAGKATSGNVCIVNGKPVLS